MHSSVRTRGATRSVLPTPNHWPRGPGSLGGTASRQGAFRSTGPSVRQRVPQLKAWLPGAQDFRRRPDSSPGGRGPGTGRPLFCFCFETVCREGLLILPLPGWLCLPLSLRSLVSKDLPTPRGHYETPHRKRFQQSGLGGRRPWPGGSLSTRDRLFPFSGDWWYLESKWIVKRSGDRVGCMMLDMERPSTAVRSVLEHTPLAPFMIHVFSC